jgi:hypothetical protein
MDENSLSNPTKVNLPPLFVLFTYVCLNDYMFLNACSAPYLSTPKATQTRPAAVVPHGGENQLLWLRTEAMVGGAMTHGGNANRWLLCREAQRGSPGP